MEKTEGLSDSDSATQRIPMPMKQSSVRVHN